MSSVFALRGALAGLVLVGTASLSSAAVIGPIDGNECAGQGGFSNCELEINGQVTPAIIKFDTDFDVEDISTQFPSVTGDEFSFFNIVENEGEVTGADFTYTLGENDPGITGFAVFAAGRYLLYDAAEFSFADGVYSGSFSTFGLGRGPNNPTPELSHITFFDTEAGNGGEPEVIPLPAGALLLLTGLGGLAVARRRSA